MLTGLGRLIAAASVLTLLVGFVVAAVWGAGYERSRALLSGGGAWLASNRGLVTLLDGTSDWCWAASRCRSPALLRWCRPAHQRW